MRRVMRLVPGTENLRSLAARKAAQLSELARGMGVDSAQRTLYVRGAKVFVRGYADGGYFVASVSDNVTLRAWHQAAPTQSIESVVADSVKLTKPYYPANWSADFGAFARYDGTSVVLQHGSDAEYAVPGSATLPDFSKTPFFQNSVCYMSPKGNRAICGTAAPSATSVAKVSTWTAPPGQLGSWATADVPFPPVDLAGVDFTTAAKGAVSSVDAPASYWGASRNVADPNPYIGLPHTIVAAFSWGVFVSPFDGKLYVDVRADSPYVSGYYVVSGITLRFWTFDVLQQLWAYDPASGSWAKVAQGPDGGTPAAAVTLISEHGDASNGYSYGTGFCQSTRDLSHYEVMFGPDAPHLVSFDNRSLPQPTHVDHTFDGDGLPPQVVRDACSRNGTATVNLDGTAWATGVNVDAAAGAASLVPLYVGTARRGAVQAPAAGGGKAGVVWEHALGETVLAQASAIFSKTGSWMFYGSGQTTAYQDGALVYKTLLPGATVMKSSWKTEGQVLVQYNATTLFSGQGGAVDIAGQNTIAVPSSPTAPVNALSLDGGTYFTGGLTFTAASLSAAFGGLPVKFTPNGVPVLATSGSAPQLAIASFSPLGMALLRPVPFVIPATGPNPVTYDRSQVVPDDFVIR